MSQDYRPNLGSTGIGSLSVEQAQRVFSLRGELRRTLR